jgi:uncharacterized CHY-type Zn-finger protein
MNIQSLSSSVSQYYYQCQECRDSFICPDWQPMIDGSKDSKVAVCPYCKSKQLDAHNAALPLVTH